MKLNTCVASDKLHDKLNNKTDDYQKKRINKRNIITINSLLQKNTFFLNQIAVKLFSSELTIKACRRNIIQKIQLGNVQNSLTKFANQNSIFLNKAI